MSKEITKELYEKAACWMADCDVGKRESKKYLLDEAYHIMFRIYEIYNEAP